MKTLIKAISLISAIMFLTINLYSQDINSSKKNKLLIYNFTTNDNYDNDKEKKKNHEYYSIVIPETLLKSLAMSGKYEIIREKGPFSDDTGFKDVSSKTKYIQALEKLNLQSKPDYIITGSFTVDESKLSVRATIFDVKGKDIATVSHESDELGVEFLGTTDTLSQRISDSIEQFKIVKLKKQEKSPFIALYNPFSIITLGIDSGYLFILRDWHNIYNNTLYISPFLDFDISDNFSLSFKFTQIQSDSDEKDDLAYSQIRILSGSMSVGFIYRFSSNFGIALTAGGGVSKTSIIVNPAQPFEKSSSEKKSTDPNVDFSSYFICNMSALTLRAGVLYKRIFYMDKPMDTGIIFGGAGIHF